jgi:hypothetical protein
VGLAMPVSALTAAPNRLQSAAKYWPSGVIDGGRTRGTPRRAALTMAEIDSTGFLITHGFLWVGYDRVTRIIRYVIARGGAW